MANNAWFAVDKTGLAKLLERKGKEFILFELLQNAWDAPGTTEVSVELKPIGRQKVELTIQDNSAEGFLDLEQAHTLFKESIKKDNPLQRGQFNLGEKLVLALCETVTISSMTGSVHFTNKGRHRSATKL